MGTQGYPRSIAIVAEGNVIGRGTQALIRQSLTARVESQRLDRWLVAHTEFSASSRARLKAIIDELDRFEVDPSALQQAGYHGRRLAHLLVSYHDDTAGASTTATIDSAPGWQHARLDFELTSSRELAALTAAASDDAVITIANWRSPDLDPTTKRAVAELTSHGFHLRGHFQQDSQPAVDPQVYHFTDPDQEVAWVLAEIMARLHTREMTMNDIVIYLPGDPSYHRALRHYSYAYQLPIAFHEQRQASFTTLGRHILELIEFLDLGHVLGSAHRSRLLATLLANFGSISGAVGPWGDFVEWLILIVNQMLQDPALSSQVSYLDQALIAELSVQLQRLQPTGNRKSSCEDFLRSVRILLETIDLDDISYDEGITVARSGQPIGHHRLVFVLGAVDGQFPFGLSDNPVLPLAVRDRVEGLPTTAELVLRQRASAIGTLQSASQELVIAAPQRIDTNRTLPSLLLAELGLRSRPAPPRYAVLSMERSTLETISTETTDRLDRAVSIERQRIQGSERSAHAGLVGPIALRPLSATQLEDLGQCPFRWFVKHRLKVKPPDDETNDPDPRILGQLVHTLLEHLSKEEDSPITREILEEKLDQLAPLSLTTFTPNWPAIRAEIAKQLAALTSNPEFTPDKARTQVELELHGDWYGIPVQGRIDRLDEVGSKVFEIIDYKYSKSAPTGIQDADRRLKIDVQLSVYTKMVEQQLGQVIGAKYCLVKQATFVKAPGISKGEEPTKEAAARMLLSLCDGYLPVAPDAEHQACNYCDFAQSCRIASHNAG